MHKILFKSFLITCFSIFFMGCSNESSVNSLVERALSLNSAIQRDEAISIWEKVVNITTKGYRTPGTHNITGMQPENLAILLHHLSDQIKQNKGSYKAFTDRGFIFSLLNLPNYALSDFTKAIEIYPEGTDARFYRGLANIKEKRVKEGLNDIDKYLNIDQKKDLSKFKYTNIGDAFYIRGIVKLSIDKREEADGDIRSAIQNNSTYGELVIVLGKSKNTGQFSVIFDPFGAPEYSFWPNKGKKELRSLYFSRGVGETRWLVVWEIHFYV